tara:strand:+ start:295 stop:921 length:627 start_codon:yes stop_codon:yes gene_type:complete
MTKTDYELTIGGKLRKVYKNSGGFFVKMNGGNLDVNEYFLKNGGGLKSKYKKKITGGYPIFLIKNNTNLKTAVTGFFTNNIPPDTINFSNVVETDNVTLTTLLQNIKEVFYTQSNTPSNQITSSYNVTVVNGTGTVNLLLTINPESGSSTDYSTIIQNDIRNFYKMYILYYFFKGYIETDKAQTDIRIQNYNNFIEIADSIIVEQASQ